MIRREFNESDRIWQAKLDKVYDVEVFRTAPYRGTLLVTDADGNEIGRTKVTLSFDALFGPDVADVEMFQDEGVKIVDRRN